MVREPVRNSGARSASQRTGSIRGCRRASGCARGFGTAIVSASAETAAAPERRVPAAPPSTGAAPGIDGHIGFINGNAGVDDLHGGSWNDTIMDGQKKGEGQQGPRPVSSWKTVWIREWATRG